MNYGWMDWKLTIWKHKLYMSATQNKQKGYKFIFLLQFATYSAVIITYFYNIISILQF